jgi:hypothetical protein
MRPAAEPLNIKTGLWKIGERPMKVAVRTQRIYRIWVIWAFRPALASL